MKRATWLALSSLCLLPACAEVPGDPESVDEAAEALTTDCDYLNDSVWAPLAPPVNYTRELLITDLAVIDEPCRTTWTLGGGCGANRGLWTFGELMTRMAGAVPPQVFVADWLHSWEVGNVVNGFPVPARPGIRGAIIDPWLIASGFAAGDPIVGGGARPLDLKKAPFRLLGIANRVDLGGAGFGAVDPGEARFVFGATGGGDPILGGAVPFTVIFEYKLPPQRGGVAYNDFNWASDWHVLSDAATTGPVGSAAYLAQLTGILHDITRPGAWAGKPNFGSSIGQVRTNEVAFGAPPSGSCANTTSSPPARASTPSASASIPSIRPPTTPSG